MQTNKTHSSPPSELVSRCKSNQKLSIPQIKSYFISEEQQSAEERKASAPLSQQGLSLVCVSAEGALVQTTPP